MAPELNKMLDQIMETMHEINEPLIARGRFLAPILVQNQFAMQVEDLCAALSREQDDQTVRQLLKKIDHLVSIHCPSFIVRKIRSF